MAGHSQFKNIMHRKGRQDAKKTKLATAITARIMGAVRQGGADPESNIRLRNALNEARIACIPKDRVQRALNPAKDDVYEDLIYNAYAACGMSMIIHCLTSNKNRMASELRTILSKNNAKIENVSHLFRQLGCIKTKCSLEKALHRLGNTVPADLDEEPDADGNITMFFELQDMAQVRKDFADVEKTETIEWVPYVREVLVGENLEKAEKLLDFLDSHPDVQEVWVNV